MLLRTARVLFVVLTLGAAACSPGPGEPAQPMAPPPAEATTGLTLVADASRVCMVNNTFMGQPQAPVVIEGKTYFGCCPACRGRLTTEPALRTARDPVTGEAVDKARAVLARDDRNTILYFASAETMQRYQPAR